MKRSHPMQHRMRPLHHFHHACKSRLKLPSRYRLADTVRNTYDERVAHAERAIDIAHTGIRPALGETLQLVELVGN